MAKKRNKKKNIKKAEKAVKVKESVDIEELEKAGKAAEAEETADVEKTEKVEETVDAEKIEEIEEAVKVEETVGVEVSEEAEETAEAEETVGAEKTEKVEEAADVEKTVGVEEAADVEKTVGVEVSEEAEETAEAEETVGAEKTEKVKETADVEKTEEVEETEKAEADKKDKVNFRWETFDDNAKKKKGIRLFSFIKRKPARKRLPIWLRVLIGMFCVLVIAAAGLFAYAYFSVPGIDPGTSTIYSNIDQSSIIYDAKGEEIDKLYYTEDREIVSIKDIPENTKNAFIAIEDKTFYKHHGLNYKRLFGAVLSKLTGRSSEISGTSTITQQLARNVFLADIKSQRTISRKVREMIYALKIERAFSKDEILEAYLNTIYLGYGCYGINAAAHTYFGKEVKDLSLAESAALAALPQAPDSYALLKDEADDNTTYLKKYGLYANNLSVERRDLVLDLMAEQGYIDSDKAEKAKKKLSRILHPRIDKKPKELTYFIDYLTAQVAEDIADKYSMSKDEAERLIHTGGLRIYSTVDQDIQNAINTEFSDDYNFPYAEEDPQAAMVVAEVGTGRIRAMVGGRNTSGQMLFNRATSPRQPGSSIKPLAVYSAALQKSEDYAQNGQTFPFTDFGIDRQGVYRWGDYITAGSTVVDERLFINGEVWPLNFSRGFSGYRTFRTALQQSINTCAVKIQLQVGADYSMEMLRKYGLSTLADDASKPVNDYNPAALALGAMTYGATPLDMAIAYGAFPNKGIRNSAAAYTKVTNSKGKDLLVKKIESTKVLDENVAFIMRDCLVSVVTRGIARNAYIYGTEVGGKTGTTNDDYDYWFVGFTPKYSAALWIGTDHNTEMSSSSASAALLWSRIMEQIPDITEGEYPPQPEDVVNVYGEYYTEKTQPYR